MVRISTSSYKIDYVIVIKDYLNPEGHQNPISGSKDTAILLKRWILPIGEASSRRVCACSLCSRLVSHQTIIEYYKVGMARRSVVGADNHVGCVYGMVITI